MADKNITGDRSRILLQNNVPWKITDVLFSYALIFSFSLIIIGFLLITNTDVSGALLPVMLQIIMSFITVGIVYGIITRKYNISFTEALGIHPENFSKNLLSGLFVSFLLLISTTIISVLFTEVVGVTKENPYSDIPLEKIKILSIVAIFVAPVVEEIFFRGFMQPALIRSFGIYAGIFVTALIFGFSHIQYLNYSTALFAVMAIGLILGITRQKTGSIMPCIFAHLINNFFAALSLY